MKHASCCLLSVVILSACAVAPPSAPGTPDEQAAVKVMNAFLAAFNAEDLAAWRATLHYPHVRIASDRVAVTTTPDDYASPDTFERLRATGWRQSRWTDMRVVQSGPRKVHIAVEFTRYDANNDVVGVFESLYIVTEKDGRWGVQARSSFAP